MTDQETILVNAERLSLRWEYTQAGGNGDHLEFQDVDIVCSVWRHTGVHKRTGKDLRPFLNNRNLQNMPSSSTFAKIIKACFGAIAGWLFSGSDFDSLEDKINTLLTRDPNKEKVYIDGFDGHCLRAQSYWPEAMPDIQQAARHERCFVVKVGGTDIRFKTGNVINYQGTTYTAEDFYEKATNNQL